MTGTVPALGAATVKVNTAVWVTPPDAAVTVTFDVPADALPMAVNVPVNTLEPAPGPFNGLKDAVTPLGRPAAESAMFPKVPLSAVMVMAVAPLAP